MEDIDCHSSKEPWILLQLFVQSNDASLYQMLRACFLVILVSQKLKSVIDQLLHQALYHLNYHFLQLQQFQDLFVRPM